MKSPVATFTCPCCGFGGLSANPYSALPPPPWKEDAHGEPPYCRKYGDVSYEVCSCCGYEFGNDDEPGTAKAVSFQKYREEWIVDGCHWFDPRKKKDGWSFKAQLMAAGIL